MMIAASIVSVIVLSLYLYGAWRLIKAIANILNGPNL